MKTSKRKKVDGDDALLAALRSCGPVARGSLSSVRMRCAKKGCAACMAGTSAAGEWRPCSSRRACA